MTAFFQGVASLSPDVQLVLALCLFAIILTAAVSPSAKQNLCDLFTSLASFFTSNHKQPQKPAKSEKPPD